MKSEEIQKQISHNKDNYLFTERSKVIYLALLEIALQLAKMNEWLDLQSAQESFNVNARVLKELYT